MNIAQIETNIQKILKAFNLQLHLKITDITR